MLRTASPPTERVRRAVVPAASAFAAAALAAGVVAVGDPTRTRLFPPCPFHAAAGLWCPGCGSARALHQLTGGHLGTAFDLNPFVVVALPFLVYAWAAWALPALGLPAPRPRPLPAWAVRAVAGTVLLFGVLRNLPVAPFRFLAP